MTAMKWAVYWEPDDIEVAFYRSKEAALSKVDELIARCHEMARNRDGELPFWDITLLEVAGEVAERGPWEGLTLKEVA